MEVRRENLELLTDFIHDSRTDLERINLDRQTKILSIPFYREKSEDREIFDRFLFIKKYRVPEVEFILELSHAEEYHVHEPYERGPWPGDLLLCIKYDENEKRIWIETSFTKGIEIKVTGFEVSVITTDRVIGTKTYSAIFPPRRATWESLLTREEKQ